MSPRLGDDLGDHRLCDADAMSGIGASGGLHQGEFRDDRGVPTVDDLGFIGFVDADQVLFKADTQGLSKSV